MHHGIRNPSWPASLLQYGSDQRTRALADACGHEQWQGHPAIRRTTTRASPCQRRRQYPRSEHLGSCPANCYAPILDCTANIVSVCLCAMVHPRYAQPHSCPRTRLTVCRRHCHCHYQPCRPQCHSKQSIPETRTVGATRTRRVIYSRAFGHSSSEKVGW